ncbi:MAG: hypothetical protein P8K68_00260 [Algibacter sp.]|uniref:hypothetical protein n=1 Tax=Algibacter sp. TaxID=1872428 RepID=UPI00262C0E81|nr:hypothetical protein [Algibacter sp.]MDG1728968.1 hypothetical protein [Algibacter sp.]MDG2177206.1 hypothetical protein [Algibacter sp.]
MELKEFISETIKQIADGLVEGHNHIKEKYEKSDGIQDAYKKIHFDVAITSSDEDKINGGGKIKIASVFDLGAKAEGTSKTTNHNRIQFETFLHVKTKSGFTG